MHTLCVAAAFESNHWPYDFSLQNEMYVGFSSSLISAFWLRSDLFETSIMSSWWSQSERSDGTSATSAASPSSSPPSRPSSSSSASSTHIGCSASAASSGRALPPPPLLFTLLRVAPRSRPPLWLAGSKTAFFMELAFRLGGLVLVDAGGGVGGSAPLRLSEQRVVDMCTENLLWRRHNMGSSSVGRRRVPAWMGTCGERFGA